MAWNTWHVPRLFFVKSQSPWYPLNDTICSLRPIKSNWLYSHQLAPVFQNHRLEYLQSCRCYNCGDFGTHLASRCPHSEMPKRCHHCKDPGHLIGECPTLPEELRREQEKKEDDKNGTEGETWKSLETTEKYLKKKLWNTSALSRKSYLAPRIKTKKSNKSWKLSVQ